MRNTRLLLLSFIFFACNTNSPGEKKPLPIDTPITVTHTAPFTEYHQPGYDSALEARITEAIMKLSFIKKADAYIDSFSNHRHGMAFMMDSLEKGQTEIYVKAGYNGDERFETYYHLYVNPKTLEIHVMDITNDKKLPVKEFLKTLH